MERLNFNITIDAPRQKVWDILWGKDTYSQWTSVFSEGSTAETDWQQGSKVHFLDGKGSGMYSTIERAEPGSLMSIRHIGMIKDGKEVPAGGQDSDWANAMETYALRDHASSTELMVDVDASGDFKDYLNSTFPRALEKVKQLAEQ